MNWRTLIGGALLSLHLAGCGGAPATTAAPATGDPYAGYPPCIDAPPAAEGLKPIEGLVLPDGATVQSSAVTGPLTTVNAYVEKTPMAVRSELERHTEATVVHVEDEVFEAELLLDIDGHRSLVKAVSVCDKASRLVAVISDGAGEALPAPGGAQP